MARNSSDLLTPLSVFLHTTPSPITGMEECLTSSRWSRRLVLAAATLAAFCLHSTAVHGQAPAANPIFDQLVQKGVPFGSRFRKIRPPTLPDGLTAAQQEREIMKVLEVKNANSQGQAITYAAFIDKNAGINGPYVLFVNDAKMGFGGPLEPGHSIDLWFVVYGRLDAVTNPKFLKEQFQPDSKDQIDVLKPAELPLEIPAPGAREWYVHGQFMVLPHDLRVRVRGTSHAMETVNPNSGILAAITDQRFNNSPTFPNEWRPVVRDASQQILRDAKGDPQLGQPTPYDSTGGYIKMTKLVAPADAMLVEYHLVYDEPYGWFGGNNLLRGKLSTPTQTNVRKFRREVRDASKEAIKETK